MSFQFGASVWKLTCGSGRRLFFAQHSMDERVVPLHVVGEEAPERDSEDADWELAWRKIRLFPDLHGLSWMLFVSSLCLACTAFNTLYWLMLFGLLLSLVYLDLDTKSTSLLDDLVYTGVEALSAIVSLFSVGFTLYACISRGPLPCWRPRWRCVAHFGALCVFVTDLVFLASSAYELWQWHDSDWNRYKGMHFSSKQDCESAQNYVETLSLVSIVGCVVVLSFGVVRGRCQPTWQEGVSPSAGGAQGREDPLGEGGVLQKVARGGKMHSTLPRP